MKRVHNCVNRHSTSCGTAVLTRSAFHALSYSDPTAQSKPSFTTSHPFGTRHPHHQITFEATRSPLRTLHTRCNSSKPFFLHHNTYYPPPAPNEHDIYTRDHNDTDHNTTFSAMRPQPPVLTPKLYYCMTHKLYMSYDQKVEHKRFCKGPYVSGRT